MKYSKREFGNKPEKDYSLDVSTKSLHRRKSFAEKQRFRKRLKTVCLCIGAAALFAFGFVIADTLLNISELPVRTSSVTEKQGEAETKVQETKPPAAQTADFQFKAIYANENSLGSMTITNAVIQNAKSSGANTVMITLKNRDGTLNYRSALEQAVNIDANVNASDMVSQCIGEYKKAGLKVAAQIHCFRDKLAAARISDAGVKYMETKMLWLDNSKANGGVAWLNPYSESAQTYLLNIIKEVTSLGVDYIVLDSVQFPAVSLRYATFTGESEQGALTKNATLLSFIEKAVTGCDKIPVIVMTDGSVSPNEINKRYDGNLFGSTARAYIVDLRSSAIPETDFAAEGRHVITISDNASDRPEYLNNLP